MHLDVNGRKTTSDHIYEAQTAKGVSDKQWVLLCQGMDSAAHLERSNLNTPQREAVKGVLNSPTQNLVLALDKLNIDVSTWIWLYFGSSNP